MYQNNKIERKRIPEEYSKRKKLKTLKVLLD
jgi:hypothetical protein